MNVNNKNSITVAAYYRPQNRTDEAYLSQIRDDIASLGEKKRKKKHLSPRRGLQPTRHLLGNSASRWKPIPNCVHHCFLDLTTDNSLNQMVTFLALKDILVHRIRISEILPWDRKSYLTHAILSRTSSNVIL